MNQPYFQMIDEWEARTAGYNAACDAVAESNADPVIPIERRFRTWVAGARVSAEVEAAWLRGWDAAINKMEAAR